ncbi:polysaccharide export protein [Rhodobacteraceae bacterium CCMM004]|nr:polysaccharide export protein [Rhodobacteraceae bacterium CCMM004]
MKPMRAARLLTILLIAAVASCGPLPRGAAVRGEIERDTIDTAGYAYYPVTRALLPTLDAWPAVNVERSYGWPKAGGGSIGRILAPGDVVGITIWESSENSLLTSAGARNANLGSMVISPRGTVFLPYAGEVRIAGMAPDRARSVLQARIDSIAAAAQVQLSAQAGRSNSVDLVSGVASPGTFPLTDRNTSVLSLISQGGGIPPTMRNPRVKLQRGHKIFATSVDRLYDNPALDSVLRGGDKVIVEEDERYFLALGATGTEKIVYFDRDYVTALEAISMVGGILDSRADPEGILVLREYPRAALGAGLRGPREQRVVFSIDLTEADGLFSAKNMQIYPQDVVLATESPVSTLQVALGLIGTTFGLANAVASN